MTGQIYPDNATTSPPTASPPTGVRLEGGPRDFPEELRWHLSAITDTKVKVQHGGGHEHFERTDERYPAGGGEAVVYRWTTRTRIAE